VTRQLVHQNFRYANGQIADGEEVLVVNRATLTPVILYAMVSGEITLPNPITADESGNVSFYVDHPGSYDYIVNGARVPFDTLLVANLDSSILIDPASTVGLPDGTLIARTT
jgi:hypothetical protein